MILIVPSGTLSGAIGLRISIAEGSTGAGKSPQGSTDVGVGRGVAEAAGGGGGVIVGSSGPKGVAVAVAAGSIVAITKSSAGIADIKNPATLVHAPIKNMKITKVAIAKRRSDNMGVQYAPMPLTLPVSLLFPGTEPDGCMNSNENHTLKSRNRSYGATLDGGT